MTQHWSRSSSVRRSTRRPNYERWRNPLLVGASALALGTVGWSLYSSAGWLGRSGPSSVSRSEVPPAAAAKAVVSLPSPDLIRPISPEEAARENAERPFANRPDTPAAKFVLKAAADEADRALTCLTQAVYYEAAGEGADGGRAVAQVVLNRLRHPGYPATVCGVVYQGSERATGCQFTFTCDGSLLRPPAAALWNRSRKIAQDALAGKVFAPAGHATHYHADYVLPYWADSLDKSVQIGRHIFYRLRGVYGEGRAFSQRYAGHEPLLPPKPEDDAALIAGPVGEPSIAATLMDDGVTNGIKDVEKAAPMPTSPLLADAAASTLLIGGPAPSAPPRKRKQSGECNVSADNKVGPLARNDLRVGSSAGC